LETVLTRAPESIDFGRGSPEKPPKSSKKSVQLVWDLDAAGSNSVIPTKNKSTALAVLLFFEVTYIFYKRLLSNNRLYDKTKTAVQF